MKHISKLPPLAAFGIVALFYTWTVVSDNLDWRFGREQTDYYNLLVDGFLQGKLSLGADPSPELLRVADPYDPEQRPPGVALHDATLYRGQYYIYFGVVPAMLALLPFRLLTGIDLPLDAGVLALALSGYALSLWLLVDIRRRLFPRVGPVATGVIAVVLGFACGAAVLLRRSSMYDLPIASGYCFSTAALLCWYRAIFDAPHRLRWIVLTSICWGLAIGSRPIYVLAPVSLLFAYPLFMREAQPRHARAKLVAAAAVPLGIIGALLALYNHLRFGSPTEFGLRWVLSGAYESKIEKFRLRYVPWNFNARFLGAGEWGRYFPFLHDARIVMPRPHQHFGMDFSFGVLVNLPFLWLAALAPITLSARIIPGVNREWRIFLASLGWAAGSVTGFILCFYAAMARYIGDFGPGLAFLATIGALAAVAWAEAGGLWPRRFATIAVAALGLISVVTVFLFSVTVYDRVRYFNPSMYATLARFANAPVHALETLWRDEFGAIAMELVFPTEAAADRREELVATGWGEERDRVFVFYPDREHVAFGFEHAGGPLIRTANLRVDRAARHRLLVSLGSLFPPDTHPHVGRAAREARTAVLRRVRVEFNGEVVLDRYQRFHPATPGTVTIGGNEPDTRFSGKVLATTRENWRSALAAAASAAPLHPRIEADASGTFRLKVRFPTVPSAGKDPLIVSGESGRGDLLSVEYLPGRRLRFVLDHWGRQPYFSEPIAFEPGHEYRLAIQHPFYAPASDVMRRAGAGALAIILDDRKVWEFEPLFYPMNPDDIFVGYNPIGGSMVGETFSGTIAANDADETGANR